MTSQQPMDIFSATLIDTDIQSWNFPELPHKTGMFWKIIIKYQYIGKKVSPCENYSNN